MPTCSYRPAAQLRQALLDGAELALLDGAELALIDVRCLPLICRSASWSWIFFGACRA